jgi:hypothetical protein
MRVGLIIDVIIDIMLDYHINGSIESLIAYTKLLKEYNRVGGR